MTTSPSTSLFSQRPPPGYQALDNSNVNSVQFDTEVPIPIVVNPGEAAQRNWAETLSQELKRNRWFPDTIFKRKLNQLNSEKIQEFCAKVKEFNPATFEHFINMISMQTLVRVFDQNDLQKLEEVIKNMATCRQLRIQSKQNSSAAYTTKSANFLDNLIQAFDVIYNNQGPSFIFDAVMLIQLYFTMLAAPVVIALAVDQLLEERRPAYVGRLEIFGAAIATIIVAIAVFKIYKWRRPIPTTIKPLRNYTKDVMEARVEPLLCREDIIKEVFLCWQSTHNTVRTHPLLIGESGVGKTVIMMEIARRIASGEFTQTSQRTRMPKYMFGGSAGLLLPSNQMMSSDDKIDTILHAIAPHKNEIILALDEIHILFNEEHGPRYGELLKSILDTSMQGLPYILAATTNAEYQKYIASDPSRSRRFKEIFIKPLKEEQVKLVLREMMRLHFPQISVSERLLDHTYQSTEKLREKEKKLTQPEISKRILTNAISKLSTELLQPPAKNDLETAEITLKNLQSSYLTFFDSPDSQSVEQKLSQVAVNVRTLKQTVEEQSKVMESYQELSLEIAKYKQQLLELTDQITQNGQSLKTKERAKKKFIFYLHYMIPYLEEQLKLKENTNPNLIPKLNEALIDELIVSFEKTTAESKKAEADKTTSAPAQSLSYKIKKGPMGMVNIGNSCYIIATVQILFNIKDIRKLIRKNVQKNDILDNLSNLVAARETLEQTKPILQSLRQAIFKRASSVAFTIEGKTDASLQDREQSQHDAQEFLIFILNELGWTPMSLVSHVKADKIEYDRDSTHPFFIQLSLNEKSLQNALTQYFSEEKFIANNDNIHPLQHAGNQYQQWSVTTRFETLPEYLIIHLADRKRTPGDFEFPKVGRVTIPHENAHATYDITGFINHEGKSVKEGHYTAYIKNYRDPKNKERWIHCDDSKIELSEPKNCEKNAYIVLLKRVQETDSK